MDKKVIKLSSQEDLKIYMSPQRQKIMRFMRMNGEPMTPKALADMLGVSPSSAQYHIKKLGSLGIVELDHTESINGITAKFYKTADADIHIGTDPEEGLDNERKAILQNAMNDTLNGLLEVIACKKKNKDDECPKEINGEFLNGILHLTREDADKLMHMIKEFVDTHETKNENTSTWEYTLILYNAGILEKGDKK
jgi:DNA-binding transcriptional ArsR family regulator